MNNIRILIKNFIYRAIFKLVDTVPQVKKLPFVGDRLKKIAFAVYMHDNKAKINQLITGTLKSLQEDLTSFKDRIEEKRGVKLTGLNNEINGIKELSNEISHKWEKGNERTR